MAKDRRRAKKSAAREGAINDAALAVCLKAYPDTDRMKTDSDTNRA